MKKTAIAFVAIATLGSALAAAPAEARGWHRGGWGPGIGFGIAAGALAAGAYGAYGPYGYGYGPRYYGYAPAYYGGPYAYGGPRYYRRPYYRYRHW